MIKEFCFFFAYFLLVASIFKDARMSTRNLCNKMSQNIEQNCHVSCDDRYTELCLPNNTFDSTLISDNLAIRSFIYSFSNIHNKKYT